MYIKNIIHKEVVDGVEIEILVGSGVFPKDVSATIKKLEKQAETDKVKDAISKSAESSSKSIDSVYSYDITVKDSEGKELQPDTSKGEVIVVFKDIQGLDKNNRKSVKVWHVKVDLDDAEDLCLFRDIVNEVISDTNPIQVEYENEDANNKKEKENVNTISTLGKNARLVNNIDMSEIDDWTSIGTKTKKFTGIFDNTNFEYKSDNPDDENNQEEFIISGIDKKDLFIYDNSEAKIHVKVEGNYLCVPEENSELTKFLEGATNISKKWSIVKDKDKEEDKDKNENKDNIKDNGNKNNTSGANNNKGNVNNNNNNSSNNTSSNKGNNNNNQSKGNYDNVNMYDKLANNNDYKTDTEGAIEGVKTSDNEIQVELNNGMIISTMGDFEESVRLMVKEIKNGDGLIV